MELGLLEHFYEKSQTEALQSSSLSAEVARLRPASPASLHTYGWGERAELNVMVPAGLSGSGRDLLCRGRAGVVGYSEC